MIKFFVKEENLNIVLLNKPDEYYPISNVKKTLKDIEFKNDYPVAIFAGPGLNKKIIMLKLLETGSKHDYPFRPFAGFKHGFIKGATKKIFDSIPTKYCKNEYLEQIISLNINPVILRNNQLIIWGNLLSECNWPFEVKTISDYRMLNYIIQSDNIKEAQNKMDYLCDHYTTPYSGYIQYSIQDNIIRIKLISCTNNYYINFNGKNK